MNKIKKILIISVPIIIILISVGVLLSRSNKVEDVYITGIVEATHVDISSKVP